MSSFHQSSNPSSVWSLSLSNETTPPISSNSNNNNSYHHGAWEFPYITIDQNNNALAASVNDSLMCNKDCNGESQLCKWKGVSGNSLKDQCYGLHFWRDSAYQDLEDAYTKIAK
jgi:hypothetical protein